VRGGARGGIIGATMARHIRIAVVGALAVLVAAPAWAQGGAAAALRARIARSGAEAVGVYYRTLDGRDSLLLDAAQRFHAASTMKVPVMIQVFRDVDAGKLRLDDSIPVRRTFHSILDGSPYGLDPADDSDSTLYGRVGGRASVRELVELMITVSSNLAANLLIDRVGAERANRTAHALGADSIAVLRGVQDIPAFNAGRNNTTTARDLGVLLLGVANGTAASPASCRAMVDVLTRQRFNDGIPAELPPGTRVAHKTGDITAINHDAAIVYPAQDPPYVLVILTRGIQDQKVSSRLIADLSLLVYRRATEPSREPARGRGRGQGRRG
jgi:beta-lactamase class A